jgi:hypothetical protein
MQKLGHLSAARSLFWKTSSESIYRLPHPNDLRPLGFALDDFHCLHILGMGIVVPIIVRPEVVFRCDF